jgi:lysophospholipase L1-like esterase
MKHPGWLLAAVALTSYAYGLATVQYQCFPHGILKQFLSTSTARDRAQYHKLKQDFFTHCGTTADVVMVGDSLTDVAEWHELFPGKSIINRGISGNTTEGLKNRMEAIYATNADRAFVMIGVNDIAHGVKEDILLKNYQEIIQGLQQNGITPFIQSTLFSSPALHPKILLLNQAMQAYAEKQGLVFIDLNATLAPGGTLLDLYTNDGLHLNFRGYAVWKQAIEKHLPINTPGSLLP